MEGKPGGFGDKRGANEGKSGDFGVFFGVCVFVSPLTLKIEAVSPLFAVWPFCIF
jgi:hypothetical protein